MVWKAIGLCTIGELEAATARLENSSILRNQCESQLTAALERAERAEARYEALVAKLSAKAAKPDDGIIHAKNSGDVRRIFEQQVSAQAAKIEREQEN